MGLGAGILHGVRCKSRRADVGIGPYGWGMEYSGFPARAVDAEGVPAAPGQRGPA